MLILSVPRDGQLYLLQAIFRPWVMVVVRITVLGLELVLIRSRFGWRTEISACHVYLSVPRTENNNERHGWPVLSSIDRARVKCKLRNCERVFCELKWEPNV